tara:strand:- start:3682 stop:4866 length:1185 start_codon:yes stop_codon:yes gene_type:complete
MDVAASIEKTTFITKSGRFDQMANGAIIMIPAGIDIPVSWWRLNIRKNHKMNDGARVILKGADRNRRPRLMSSGNKGVLITRNQSDRRVSVELENMVLKGGIGGNALHVLKTSRLRLVNVLISGGKNGLFVPTHPTDIEIIDSEMKHCGYGGGFTHNLYTSYINSLTVRNSKFHSARAQGHAFKDYAKHLDVRDSYFAHYETDADLADGFFGELPVLDRGAWGTTIAVGNTFVRRGPVRPKVIEIRNRGYPPGYNKYVPKGWGTQEVDYHLVDNRDPSNPYLFKHLFYDNTFKNGILPDGRLDPLIEQKPGSMIRNNGSAPWGVRVKGEGGDAPAPSDWQPHYERAVVYLAKNRMEGVPFVPLADRSPYRYPNLTTPIRESDDLPEWAEDVIKA